MINTNQLFLSCDWGTSSFRLRLIEVPGLRILAEVSDHTGIASTYELWRQENNDDSQRLPFYQSIIKKNIEKLEKNQGTSLTEVPLILSGMASSSLGMKELPYKELPFSLDGSDLLIDSLPGTQTFQHHTLIISGVKSTDDVMRGEEIQLVGSVVDETMAEQIFIFPGTHSKHIGTNNGKATAFKTYMTGELFDLLCTKSILAASIDKGIPFQDENNQQAFATGVKDSFEMNPLHAFFLVRTNQLFQKMPRSENYYYLSGLLIGLELNELVNKKDASITLVSTQQLKDLYISALNQLGFNKSLKTINVDEAIVKGHCRVYLNFLAR